MHFSPDLKIANWAFTQQEEEAAGEVVNAVARSRSDTTLPLYTDAVAIDGPTTADRDDAINIIIDPEKNRLTLETYIPHSTRFIPAGGILDHAAMSRVSTLYLHDKNHPMLPRRLSDGALSLNAGRATPAIKISTVVNVDSGEIETVRLERCRVCPENITYEEVADKIRRGDSRYAAWSEVANALKKVREKQSKRVVLPKYDPETGIMQGEDGQLEYIRPQLFSSYNIVQEAMITTNHACARLMSECFPYGVYRTQKRQDTRARYTDEPKNHISLGLKPYTHVTSPNRRLPDMLVQRYLNTLLDEGGGRFELDVDATEKKKYEPPFEQEKLKKLLRHATEVSRAIKNIHKEDRNRVANKWIEDELDDIAPQELKLFDPIGFSNLLKAAAQEGEMNETFAQEIVARMEGKGGPDSHYALVQPRDIVNIFRYVSPVDPKSAQLWEKIRTRMLDQLAAAPQHIDDVFQTFIGKLHGTFHIKKASFMINPREEIDQGSEKKSAHYRPIASAIVAELDGKPFTTKEFAIGFSDRTSVARAKLEFLKAYASSLLVESEEPQLPTDTKVYLAHNLYIENAAKRLETLRKEGYRIEEDAKPFMPGKPGAKGRGYRYEMLIMTPEGSPLFSIIVKRSDREEAKRIAVETAIQELRRRNHIAPNPFAHSGLSTFTARLNGERQEGHGSRIYYNHLLMMAPKQADVRDSSQYRSLLDNLHSSGYRMQRLGKSVKIAPVRDEPPRSASWENIRDQIIAALPKAVLVMKPPSIRIDNPPQDLLLLCGREPAIQR